MFICNICQRNFKTQQGLNSHIGWHNNDKTGRKTRAGERNPMFGKKATNQFIKAKENGFVLEVKQITKDKISKKNKGFKWSNEQKKKHSEKMHQVILKNPESYSANNVCGRTKIINYNGFKLNGSWELEVAKWLDAHKIKWTNIVEGIKYEWNNKTHLYFPDFYLPELNLFLEVKGYERERDKCKWSVLNNLVILKKREIKLIRNNELYSILSFIQN